MRQTLKHILLSFLALGLGDSFLEAFQAPPQGVSFRDGTITVGPWNKRFNQPAIVNNLYDDHIMGGVLADLDGDGYPDLVLPAERNGENEPEGQNLGGIHLIPNRKIPGGEPKDRFFDWSNKKTKRLGGTEAQGILALDYDNDGDLDLLVICQGTPSGIKVEGKLDKMTMAPSAPLTNRLLNNDGFGNFTEVPMDTTDPDFDGDPNTPGTAIDGHGLAYTESPDAVKKDATTGIWSVDESRTFKPPSSACAAAADVNLDGLIDIYIAQSHRDGSLKLTGMMDALYLNGGLGQNGNWIFWDVTYDRREYQAFANDGGSPYPGINWDEYIPVFGYQGEDLFRLPASHPNHQEYKPYLVPRSKPFFRFSSSIAAYFMDLNNDGWPDLVVTGKAWIKKSLLANGALPSYRKILNNGMVYLNRGNDPDGKWLGFWNRS